MIVCLRVISAGILPIMFCCRFTPVLLPWGVALQLALLMGLEHSTLSKVREKEY